MRGKIYIFEISRTCTSTYQKFFRHDRVPLRAIYDHEVSFIIGGDFNRTAVNDILDSYGALHQVVAKPNRRGSVLSLLLTDLQTFYHPATNLPPLKVGADVMVRIRGETTQGYGIRGKW